MIIGLRMTNQLTTDLSSLGPVDTQRPEFILFPSTSLQDHHYGQNRSTLARISEATCQ